MKYIFEEFKYDKYMDNECIELCNCINSLPGLITCESCCGHDKHGFCIWFYVDFNELGEQGLFFLTRCVDHRYWKYGNIWKLELNVADYSPIKKLPTTFFLNSGNVFGEESYKQSKDLVDNMIYHLNHENFIKGYNIDLSKFKIKII